MKTLLKVLLGILTLVAVAMSYLQLQARWEIEDRIARIDQVIEARKAHLAAEAAYRNQFADRLHQQALQSERDASARWEAAKNRGKLPGNNTVPSSSVNPPPRR